MALQLLHCLDMCGTQSVGYADVALLRSLPLPLPLPCGDACGAVRPAGTPTQASVFVALNEILIFCGYAQSVRLRTWTEAVSAMDLKPETRDSRPEDRLQLQLRLRLHLHLLSAPCATQLLRLMYDLCL